MTPYRHAIFAFLKLTMLLGLLLPSTIVYANTTDPKNDIIALDDEKPITVEALTFEYDNKKGVATYTGQVRAKQGTRRLKADKLTIYRNQQGEITAMIAFGKRHPATFQLKTDKDKPPLYGRGMEIHYDRTNNLLILHQDAKLSQSGDVYTAPHIQYDLMNSIVRSPQSESGRTTIVLQPNKNRFHPLRDNKNDKT